MSAPAAFHSPDKPSVILVVDDHPLFRDGLRLLLLAVGVTDQVGCCASGEEALAEVCKRPVDLILLDWNLGAGISGKELLAALKEVSPSTRIVIVSGDSDERLVRLAIENGAVGFVPKESSSVLLADAIQIAAHGGLYLPASILATSSAKAPASASGHMHHLRNIRDVFPQLTDRHCDVLSSLVRGLSNKQIAKTLDIADGTVKQHLNAIFREMNVRNRTEAVYVLAHHGIRI